MLSNLKLDKRYYICCMKSVPVPIDWAFNLSCVVMILLPICWMWAMHYMVKHPQDGTLDKEEKKRFYKEEN